MSNKITLLAIFIGAMFAVSPFVCNSQPTWFASGAVQNIIAGEDMANFSAVYLGGDGRAYKCDRSKTAIGVTIDTAQIGDTIQMLRRGIIYNWPNGNNATWFVGDTAQLITTAPDFGNIQQVARSGDGELYIEILEPHTVNEAVNVLSDDVVRTFSTELEAVEGFSLDLVSDATYLITGKLFFYNSDAIGGYKYATSFDGALFSYFQSQYTSVGTLEVLNITGYDELPNGETISGIGTNYVSFENVVSVVEGGIYSLSFAQSVASLGEITFLTGSTLTAKRIK